MWIITYWTHHPNGTLIMGNPRVSDVNNHDDGKYRIIIASEFMIPNSFISSSYLMISCIDDKPRPMGIIINDNFYQLRHQIEHQPLTLIPLIVVAGHPDKVISFPPVPSREIISSLLPHTVIYVDYFDHQHK
jgi:hypothetical protein